MQTVTAELTDRLVMALDGLVEQGWYADRSEALRDAVRQLVQRKQLVRVEQAVDEDIRWGLGEP